MDRARALILRSLTSRPCTMWDLLREQNNQHQLFTSVLARMVADGVVESDAQGLIRLTHAGWREAGRHCVDGWQDQTCPRCAGRSVVPEGRLAGLEAEFRRLCEGRPPVTTEYDQGVVPPAVTAARVALLEQRGDLAAKDVLILGDDDLTSLAFMLSGLPRRVVVLEVDPRITNFLRSVVEARDWNVEVVDYDVRQPFPAALRQQFDVFFTDPVETVGGISLFLSRCVAGLRGSSAAGYFGLTHLESGWQKWLAIERAVLQMNLVITDVHRDFNQYNFVGPSVLQSTMKIVRDAPVPLSPPTEAWFSSTLFRLQVVGQPVPLITTAVDWGRELYADEDTI